MKADLESTRRTSDVENMPMFRSQGIQTTYQSVDTKAQVARTDWLGKTM
jgi:hypothetical protein